MPKTYALRERAGKEGGGKGPLVQEEVTGTLTPGNDQRIFQAIPIHMDATPKLGKDGDPFYTLCSREKGGGFEDSVCYSEQECPFDPNDYIVRGLTPVECERLQGFPDKHTDLTGEDPEEIVARIPLPDDDKKARQVERNVRKWCEKCPDGPRYKACGNSMAVPVIQWLGERIEMVDELVIDLMLEGEL